VPSVILANTPTGASAWYPSFTEFSSVHSPQLNISSIVVKEVLAACERIVEKLMSEKSNMER